MPAAKEQLASPFRQALLYVVQQLDDVSVMKLEKILYLADLEHFRRTGARITGARWVRHRFGPMAKATLPSEHLMNGSEIVVSGEKVGPHDARIYRRGPKPRFTPHLATDQRQSLDRVIKLAGNLTASELAKLTYNTTPMLARLKIEAEEGHEVWDAILTFDNRPREIASAAIRTPVATAEHIAAFKREELARVEDIQQAAVARSSG